MTIRCLLLGCCWKDGMVFWSVNELLMRQTCKRCGSMRTVSK